MSTGGETGNVFVNKTSALSEHGVSFVSESRQNENVSGDWLHQAFLEVMRKFKNRVFSSRAL